MRIRVIQDPNGLSWHVQARKFFRWVTVQVVYPLDAEIVGKTTKETAIEFAKRLKNPEVIEI